MTSACQKKCVPPKYSDGELSKGEAVCIDRCVAKFMDVHDIVGKKLTAMSNAEQGGGAAGLPGTIPK
ncbi:Tim10 [Bugula neritina]|uniref:Mitochondrial import inner membrane translocase subunit n=1 Tax=Bugula neritina TaxID=10212 RepID=A0A7J7KPS6_BUGNE|nr:Tim10 [Bugula neritina]